MPVAVLQDVAELQHAAGEEVADDHQGQADVEPPEGNPDVLLDSRPLLVGETWRMAKTMRATPSMPKTPIMAAWPWFGVSMVPTSK